MEASRRFLPRLALDHRGGGRLANLVRARAGHGMADRRRPCAHARPPRRRVLLQPPGPAGRRRQGLPQPVRLLRAGRRARAPRVPDRDPPAALHHLPEPPREARHRLARRATAVDRAARLRHRVPHRPARPSAESQRRRGPARGGARRGVPGVVVERLRARPRDALRRPGRGRAARRLPDVGPPLARHRRPARALVVARHPDPLRGCPPLPRARRSPPCCSCAG